MLTIYDMTINNYDDTITFNKKFMSFQFSSFQPFYRDSISILS